MKPSQYSSIMPQIALANLKLIDFNDLVCLIGKDLDEIFSFLLTTPYREEIANTCGDKVVPSLLEEALLQNYAKIFNKLLKFSTKHIKDLLLSILHKFDALNLKTLFRLVHAGTNTEDILQYIVPLGMYSREKCKEILSKNNSISEIVNSIQNQDFGFTLKELLNHKEIISDLSPLEATLDKEVFTRIFKAINKLNRKDKKIATNILGIELDALNVKIILKYKSLITHYENIEEYLMPTALIDRKTLISAGKDIDLKSALQRFLKTVETGHQVYLEIFKKLVKESNSPKSKLEFILERASLEMSIFELKKNSRYYNIGFLLAFLNMKWAEIKNLRCIINATERKVEGEQIHNLLILPE